MKFKVFVYGTLKKGGWNHSSMDGSRCIGTGSLGKDYSLFVDSLPKVVRAPSECGVDGELYEVNYETLKKLDKLEGHPLFYKRELVEIFLSDGSTDEAYVYIYQSGVSSGAYRTRSYNVQSR